MADEVPQLVERQPSYGSSSSLPFPSDTKRVPITILTGFLGAGKSTLLNYILSQNDAKTRFAVIMNEFGDTAKIERAVSIQTSGESAVEDWLELPNGCMCCTIKTTAMQAIEELLHRKRGQIDYILLETTGLADPYPIIESFWVDEALECDAYLDGVVCLVDSKNITTLMKSHPVLRQQIILADILLLNKIDLIASSAAIDVLTEDLNALNPLAKLYVTQYSQIPDLSRLLDLKAYGSIDCTFALQKQTYLDLLAALSFGGGSQKTSANVKSLRLSTTRAINREKFERWLFSLLWEKSGNEILRVKGLISLQEGGDVVVQAVRDLYEITDLTRVPKSLSESVLVVLGDFNDEDVIRSSFHSSVF